MQTKKFFTVFFLVVFVLISITIAINVFVNPYGYYGDKQLGMGELFNSHVAKYDYLNDNKLKPEAIVLGSSNSMKMLPKTIDSLFGLKAFNYGVYQAGIEDFYCVSNVLMKDLNIKPKLFIICIDDWNFSKGSQAKDQVFERAQNRLAYKYRFSKYLSNFSWITLWWCQFKSSLSLPQTQYSLGNLKNAIASGNFERQNPPISQAFYNDGTRKKYGDNDNKDITDIAEQGKYEITKYLKNLHAKELKKNTLGIVHYSNEDFENLDPQRMELLEKLVKYYEENNVKVIFNIMPVQPFFQDLLYKLKPQYQNRISQLKTYFSNLQKLHKNIILVKDNHEIKNFNGNSEYFFDQLHPTSANSDLMLISIKNQLGNYAF